MNNNIDPELHSASTNEEMIKLILDADIATLLSNCCFWAINDQGKNSPLRAQNLGTDGFVDSCKKMISNLEEEFKAQAKQKNIIIDDDDEEDKKDEGDKKYSKIVSNDGKFSIQIKEMKYSVDKLGNFVLVIPNSHSNINDMYQGLEGNLDSISIDVNTDKNTFSTTKILDKPLDIIFRDTIKNVILFMYIKSKYHEYQNNKKGDLLKQNKMDECLIDFFLRLQACLCIQFAFGKSGYKDYDEKFIKNIKDEEVKQKLCGYICQYMNQYIKYATQEKIDKLLNIELGENDGKLANKIKSVEVVNKENNINTSLNTNIQNKSYILQLVDANIKEFNAPGEKKIIENIGQFVKSINNNNETLKDLDDYVSKKLPGEKEYFKSADEFINFKRNTIKKYFSKNEFKKENLEKLDDIVLSRKTAVNIVKKFNLGDRKQKLYNDEKATTVNSAVNTFQKLLKNAKEMNEGNENVKFLPNDFYNFLYNNFLNWGWLVFKKDSCVQFTTKDIDGMVEFVDTSEPFSTNGRIGAILKYYKFGENKQPSNKLIEFLLNSTKLYNIDSFVRIINNLLPVGHGDITKTLEYIFNGKFDNSKFFKALKDLKDIEQELSPMEMLKSSNSDTRKFAFYLLENGIEIKIENKEDGAKQFVINEKAKKLQDFLDEDLIPCLKQEDGLNKFVQQHIEKMMNKKDKELSDENLINAKSNAINAFLESNKSLEQRYAKLLSSTNLLNSVKLSAETSVYCIDKLFRKLNNHKNSDQILFHNWQFIGANSQLSEKNLNDFLCEHQSMRITKEYLDFCFTHQLISEKLNDKTNKSLYVLLLALEDGNCTDKVLNCFSSALSNEQTNITFEKLICADQETENFDQCLANAIWQLIRTSPDYADFGIGTNNDKQIEVIKNVLTSDGEKPKDYEWFRNGLFEWLSKNNDKNIDDILKKNEDLKTMLSVCGINVEYDKGSNKIKCNSSNEIKGNSLPANQIIELFNKTNRDTTVSLSEIKRIMKREMTEDRLLAMDPEQQTSFIDFISDGKIVISTSKISELFDLEKKKQVDVDDFFTTNDIARKLMWKIIDGELFDPETGLFKRKDISANEICQKYQDGLVNCLKKVKIVVNKDQKDQKEITVDLSQFQNEFLSSVGVFNSQKYQDLDDLIKDKQFSISDRNFDTFLDFFDTKFGERQNGQQNGQQNGKQNGKQIISLFEQSTNKIDDFSLSYDNAEKLIKTFLGHINNIKFEADDLNKFCLITQKLISTKLNLIRDGDDRSYYNGTAKQIFEHICKFFANNNNKDTSASHIILILDSLIRKQDECYQCGKLIDMLNEICDKYELNIDANSFQDARNSISNKIMLTDCHKNNSNNGYKFIIDFELKVRDDEKHLHIPLNVEYTDSAKNKQLTTELKLYINRIISATTFKPACDINNPNSFDSVIEHITAESINKNNIKIDSSAYNLACVVKSKSQKLSRDTLEKILKKIFENNEVENNEIKNEKEVENNEINEEVGNNEIKNEESNNKIKDKESFSKSFQPWFVHVVSHYLDFSTLNDADLSSLFELCIDKTLQFTWKGDCTLVKNFLDACLTATLKNNNKSCVNHNFINSIIQHIDPNDYLQNLDSWISSIFDFINKNADQINSDDFNVGLVLNSIVQKILSTKEHSLEDLMSKVPHILSEFNKNNLYALREKFEPMCIPITTKGDDQSTLVIECDAENGVIKQCEVFSGTYLTDYTIKEQNLQPNKSYPIDNSSSEKIKKMVQDQANLKQQQQLKNEEIAEKQKKDVYEAFEKWQNDQRRKNPNQIHGVVFLRELVNKQFDELAKSNGILGNNAIEGNKRFGGFLDGLEKIVNSLEGCKDKNIKNNLLDKMKSVKSRIKEESLTFEQMTKFLDLVMKIDGWKPNINEFLDWCKKYIKADIKKDLYKYVKNKIPYSLNTIADQLKILTFVIQEKKPKTDDLNEEIKAFLNTGILNFKKDDCDKKQIEDAVSDFLKNLKKYLSDVLKMRINADDLEKVRALTTELQDMLFDYINKKIPPNDAKLHLETSKEKEEKARQVEKEKQEKIQEQKNEKKDKLKENCDKLKNNIEGFLTLKEVTSANVKNIFEGIDIDIVSEARNFQKQQRVLTEEEQITKFIDLLSQVNKKITQIKSDNNDNKDNSPVPDLENFFPKHVLSPEQCITLVKFKVLSYPHVEGCFLGIMLCRDLVYDCLPNLDNDKKTFATTMFQIIGELKAHINLENLEAFLDLMGFDYIEFNNDSKNNDDGRQEIIKSINEHNIIQLFIYAEFKFRRKDNPEYKDITFEKIKETVKSSVPKVFKTLKGLNIDENNQLCYNANVEQVDTNKERDFIYSLTAKVINQLLEDKLIKEGDKTSFMQDLNEQKNNLDIRTKELQELQELQKLNKPPEFEVMEDVGDFKEYNSDLNSIKEQEPINQQPIIPSSTEEQKQTFEKIFNGQLQSIQKSIDKGLLENKENFNYGYNYFNNTGNFDNKEKADEDDNKMKRKKKILIGVSIPLLILAAAGIAATLVIGLAGAALAGFIVSLAVAAVAVALFIRGLCLKNSLQPPTQINTFGYRDSNFIDQQIKQAKTIEEKKEKNNDPTIEEKKGKNNKDNLLNNLIGNNNLIENNNEDKSEKTNDNNNEQNLEH